MPGFGPLSCSVGPGPFGASAPECLLLASGTGVMPSHLDVTWNAASSGYVGASVQGRVYWFSATGVQLRVDQTSSMRVDAMVGVTQSLSAPGGADSFEIRAAASPASGDTITVTVNGSYTTTIYCAYGSETNPDAQTYTILTTAVVDVIAAILGLGPLGILALDTMIGSPLFGVTCANAPPPMPSITQDDFIAGTTIPAPASVGKFAELLQVGVWFFYCRCTAAPPGSPAPTPYPVPTPPGPIGPLPPGPGPGGPQPMPPCDDGDICSTLARVERGIDVLIGLVRALKTDQHATSSGAKPLTYVAGTRHSGLTGDGTLSVTGVIGLSVESTSVPAWMSSDMEDPQSFYYLGDVSLGTADGWERKLKITHNAHLILPIEGPVDRVGYHFAPGVTANILELISDPDEA